MDLTAKVQALEKENKQLKSRLESCDFLTAWGIVASECHQTAKLKGFWDHLYNINKKTAIAEKLMLTVSELSEGLEAIREDKTGLGNLGEELADAVIRIMDLAIACDLKVGHEIVKKMAVNKDRPHRHGKEL